MFDVIVLGAGIAGASVADALSCDARVALVEMEDRPGYHATGRSATLFIPTYGPPPVRALTRASADFFQTASGEFTDHPILTDRGIVYVARRDQLQAFEESVTDLTGGTGVENIEPAEARALLPILRAGYVAAALYDRDAKSLDVDALLQGFLRRGRRAGVELFTRALASAIQRTGGAWRVDLPSGEISAPVLINAAGAWADQVAAMAGARPVGLRALRRTIAVVDPPPGYETANWPAVVDVEEQFYAGPSGGKLLISPADQDPVEPGDAFAEELTVAIAADRIQAALDIQIRRVSHSWAGLRTFAPDGEPVIGFDPAQEGFFWLAGQGGYGIQTSPAASRLAAALALGKSVPDDIAGEGIDAQAISPARFVGAPRRAVP